MKPHHTLFFGILALCALLSAQGFSHDRPNKRQARAQLELDRVSLLLTFEIPAGPTGMLLIKRFDVNSDGKLEGPEAQQAARSVLPLLLKNVQLEVPGQHPELAMPKLKLQHDAKGQITVVALIDYKLEPLQYGVTRTLILRLLENSKPNQGSFPLKAQLTTSDKIKIVASNRPYQTHASQTRNLTEGQHLKIQARLIQP